MNNMDILAGAANGASSASSASDSSSYLICVHVAGDQISVGVEPDSEEANEPSEEGGSQESADYKPVGSIEEALSMVRDIYKANGQMPADQEPGLMEAKAEYAKKTAGRPQMTAPGGAFGEG